MLRRPVETRRRGFTLAEMLMAVAIILILVAIGAFAVLRLRDTGPYQATTANMNKIKQALDTQWKAVVDKARNEPLPSGFPGDKADPATRRMYINARLRQSFPTTFAEATTSPGGGVAPWGSYVKHLAGAPAASPDQQNAICLLMILERGPNGGEVTQDRLGPSGALPVAGPLYGCVDAWGHPLQFRRLQDAQGNYTGFEIRSLGADAKPGTDDDISSNKDL